MRCSEWTPTPLTHWVLFPEGRLSAVDYKAGEHLAPSPQPQTTWLISSKKAPPRLSASKVHLIWQHDLWIQTHMFGLKCLHNNREKRFVFCAACRFERGGEKRRKSSAAKHFSLSIWINRVLGVTGSSQRLSCLRESCRALLTNAFVAPAELHRLNWQPSASASTARKSACLSQRLTHPSSLQSASRWGTTLTPTSLLVGLRGTADEKSAAAFKPGTLFKHEKSHILHRN